VICYAWAHCGQHSCTCCHARYANHTQHHAVPLSPPCFPILHSQVYPALMTGSLRTTITTTTCTCWTGTRAKAGCSLCPPRMHGHALLVGANQTFHTPAQLSLSMPSRCVYSHSYISQHTEHWLPGSQHRTNKPNQPCQTEWWRIVPTCIITVCMYVACLAGYITNTKVQLGSGNKMERLINTLDNYVKVRHRSLHIFTLREPCAYLLQ
jgi:hypothetical protein